MPQSLSDLEQRREVIAQRIAELGDLRPGSITSTSGRCGKTECHCHQTGQPGHGPNFRLTYKVDRKTISEALPTPAAIQKAQREVSGNSSSSLVGFWEPTRRSAVCGLSMRSQKRS
jgi:hypothetical protein